MYYTISEVAVMTGLDQGLLRSWEKAFSKLRPKKNRAGKRAYREKDIEVVLRIKQLLFKEKYTMDGARKKLAEERKAARAGSGNNVDVDVDVNVDVNVGINADVNADTAAADPSPDKSTATASMLPNALSDIRSGLRDILTVLES